MADLSVLEPCYAMARLMQAGAETGGADVLMIIMLPPTLLLVQGAKNAPASSGTGSSDMPCELVVLECLERGQIICNIFGHLKPLADSTSSDSNSPC